MQGRKDTQKKQWNNHISRMANGRVVGIARDKSAAGRRNVGRHWKRRSDNIKAQTNKETGRLA